MIRHRSSQQPKPGVHFSHQSTANDWLDSITNTTAYQQLNKFQENTLLESVASQQIGATVTLYFGKFSKMWKHLLLVANMFVKKCKIWGEKLPYQKNLETNLEL